MRSSPDLTTKKMGFQPEKLTLNPLTKKNYLGFKPEKKEL